MSHQHPRRTVSAGSESLSSNASTPQEGRRPVRHTVEVRSTNSAGPIRPNRLVPGLSAASREAIQRSGSSAGSVSSSNGAGGGVITPFHASNLNSGLSGGAPTPGTGGAAAGSRQRLRLGGTTGNSSSSSTPSARHAFRGIDDDEEVEDEHAVLLAQVLKKREEAEKDRERRSVMSSYSATGTPIAGGQKHHHSNISSVPRSERSHVLPPGTARSVATTSASSLGLRSAISTVSSLSMKALSKIEQALGKELPLSRDGAKVVLSKDDVKKIKDQETLSFLAEYGSLFVNSMQEDKKLAEELAEDSNVTAADDEKQQREATESSVAGAENSNPTKQRTAKFSSADVEATMNQLANEIATFITATDEEGKDYSIPTEAMSGELHVPLLSSGEGGADHDANILLLGGGEEDDDDKDLTGFEDLLAADTPARQRPGGSSLASAEDRAGAAEQQEETSNQQQEAGSNLDPSQDPDSEEVFQRKLREVLSEEAEEKLLLGDIPELANDEDDGLGGDMKSGGADDNNTVDEEIPEEVDENTENTPQIALQNAAQPSNKSAFKSTFCSRPTKKQDTPQTRDGAAAGDESARLGTGRGKVAGSSSSSGPVQGPTKSLQKDAFYKLNTEEEARVQWILDNEDWDQKKMSGGGGDNDDDIHSTAPSTTNTTSSTTTTSSSSKLHYDPSSTSSYAPSDGYGQDTETKKRLDDIDARLAKLQKARSLAGGPSLEGLGYAAVMAGGERLQIGSGGGDNKLLTAARNGSGTRSHQEEDDEGIISEELDGPQADYDHENRGGRTSTTTTTPNSSPTKKGGPTKGKSASGSTSTNTTPLKSGNAGKNVNIPTPPKAGKKQQQQQGSSSSSTVSASDDASLDEADQRRLDARKKGNEVLHNQRVGRAERKMMNQLNDRLSDISAQLELLSQPPFSLEVQYDLNQDPKDLEFPPGLAPPDEDQIQALLAQCQEEQRLYSDLAS